MKNDEEISEEDRAEIKRVNRNKVIFICIIAVVYSLFKEYNSGARDYVLAFYLARVIGSAFGLLLLPVIPALISALLTKKWREVYVTFFLVFLASSLIWRLAS